MDLNPGDPVTYYGPDGFFLAVVDDIPNGDTDVPVIVTEPLLSGWSDGDMVYVNPAYLHLPSGTWELDL